MKTPFEHLLENINHAGFHNHRTEEHSDIVSNLVWQHLTERCPALRADFESGVIKRWQNVKAPGGRNRRIDLFVGEPRNDKPDPAGIRLGLENKSVITAHRNATNRYDDLNEVLEVVHARRPEAVLAATVIVGLATRYLNVPDRIKPMMKENQFERRVRKRLSSGDQRLWTDFPHAVSQNRSGDAERTATKFRQLPLRPIAQTHRKAYDFLLLVPMHIDNVDPPRIPDLDAVREEYDRMIEHLCRAYTARWHS